MVLQLARVHLDEEQREGPSPHGLTAWPARSACRTLGAGLATRRVSRKRHLRSLNAIDLRSTPSRKSSLQSRIYHRLRGTLMIGLGATFSLAARRQRNGDREWIPNGFSAGSKDIAGSSMLLPPIPRHHEATGQDAPLKLLRALTCTPDDFAFALAKRNSPSTRRLPVGEISPPDTQCGRSIADFNSYYWSQETTQPPIHCVGLSTAC